MSYINMIPTASLFMLSEWDPELKLQAFRGLGSLGTNTENYEIVMGNAKIGQTSISQNIKTELLYEFGNGELAVKDVYERVKEVTGLPDISLESIVYVERDCRMGNPELKIIRNHFDRRSLHPGIFKNMVMDGEYPLQEVHVMLDEIKKSFEDLPREIKQRVKPSCLLSSYFPDVSDDGPCVYALKRPYMVFMKATARFWKLFDLEYRKRGGA